MYSRFANERYMMGDELKTERKRTRFVVELANKRYVLMNIHCIL